MDIQDRLKLIGEVGEEIITEEELKELLQKKKNPIAYDGFEPSGKIHIAQGIMRSININKMTKAGVKFKMLVADWHAWANNKMGGDLEKIQTVGKYLIEVWKTTGMNLDKVEFIWANDLIQEQDYWKKVMQIARNSTVNRIIRCGQIMGRREEEVMQASQILYPCMQCADIFQLQADITQLGMDQRKVNVLAREVGPKLGWWKPIIVSHHMLAGLQKVETNEKETVERAIEMKMSKSKPDTAIFMTDNEEEVKRKIMKAYCPEKEIIENPIIEYYKYILFEKFKEIKIERKKQGELIVDNYKELIKSYLNGEIHPLDLKEAAAKYVNNLIEPVRKHFKTNTKAKKLLDQVNSYEVTR
ncbi:MAG: tyrosine--tRNA ligase [Candidatus Woesearchaeota archaeon]